MNEKPVEVPLGTSALEAVRLFDGELADTVKEGGYLTDGVGREIPNDSRVEPGTIIRAIKPARKNQNKENED